MSKVTCLVTYAHAAKTECNRYNDNRTFNISQVTCVDCIRDRSVVAKENLAFHIEVVQTISQEISELLKRAMELAS